MPPPPELEELVLAVDIPDGILAHSLWKALWPTSSGRKSAEFPYYMRSAIPDLNRSHHAAIHSHRADEEFC